jgi:Icc-related predicted phosphoesterase
VTQCLFASDLHGRPACYRVLFDAVAAERPAAILLGGDLLPSGRLLFTGDPLAPEAFVDGFLLPELAALHDRLGDAYPRVLVILGNDDPASAVAAIEAGQSEGLLEHVHGRRVALGAFFVYGYACVPPTPFLLKDWERYDVSRFVDAGCVSPEEGVRTVPVDPRLVRRQTIARDLDALTRNDDLSRAVMLFHAPPYRTLLDRAALDGRGVDGVPLDTHVGSIAVRRFIEARQPLLTLHGHVHEAVRLTGAWHDVIGRTVMFSAAHDDLAELALVRLNLDTPEQAWRELIRV